MFLLEVFILIITILTLLLTIVIYVKVRKEPFENCVGVQYNGLNFLDNPKAPICTKGIKSRFADGGCLEYNPQQVAIDYMDGKFTPAV